MDTIMKIYANRNILEVSRFFFAKRILQAFSDNYMSILPERLNVNVEDLNMHTELRYER